MRRSATIPPGGFTVPTMGNSGPTLAFFGSMSLMAKEIRSVLESRAFPAGDVKLYDESEEGAITEFAGEAVVVTRPDEEAILGVDIAFLCGSRARMTPYLDWPGRRGYVGIDMSGASLDRSGVPLVHAGINPEAIRDGGPGGAVPPLIGAPHAVSHNLATVVEAARRVGRVTALEAVALRPVSEMGDKGIDELYQQTVAVLNFSPVPQEVFGRQIAFNILPAPGTPQAEPWQEERISAETARMLAMDPGRISLTSAFLPMFHGHATAVSLQFEHPVDAGALAAAFGAAGSLRLVTDPALATPVDLAGEERVAVLGMEAVRHRPEQVRLWTFCDNLKGGAALNAVRIAERLVEQRLAQEAS